MEDVLLPLLCWGYLHLYGIDKRKLLLTLGPKGGNLVVGDGKTPCGSKTVTSKSMTEWEKTGDTRNAY